MGEEKCLSIKRPGNSRFGKTSCGTTASDWTSCYGHRQNLTSQSENEIPYYM